jgi:NitT/TauT family transport system permease protein
LIGSAIAAPAGLIMGSVHVVRATFDPYAQFFRCAARLAHPVVLWFGIGEISKVLIIIYTTMFIVLINTMVGSPISRPTIALPRASVPPRSRLSCT